LRLTNHQLLNKSIGWKLIAPYTILLRYKGEFGQATAAFGGRSEAPNNIKNAENFIWSNLLHDVRTFFEEESSQ